MQHLCEYVPFCLPLCGVVRLDRLRLDEYRRIATLIVLTLVRDGPRHVATGHQHTSHNDCHNQNLFHNCYDSKTDCKDNIKVTLVFQLKRKFYQKIVFFSFSRLIEEPFEDDINPFRRHAVLLCHLPSRFFRNQPFGAGEEVVIDDGLVANFDLMSFLRHSKVVRVSY